MNLGFIGTGEITKSVILGVLKSKIKFNKIFISKRNNKISDFLKKKNKKIIVLNDNQKIINHTNKKAVMIDRRPDDLSGDNVATVDVLLELLHRFKTYNPWYN